MGDGARVALQVELEAVDGDADRCTGIRYVIGEICPKTFYIDNYAAIML